MNNLFSLMCEGNPVLNFFNKILQGIKDFFSNSKNTIINVLLLTFLGILVIKLLTKLLYKIFSKTKVEHLIYNYIITIIKIILYFTLIMSILGMLGIDTTSIIALLTTLSLALSLAMETIFSNLANGLIIIVTKPFKEGDWISIDDYEGSVKDIRLLNTILNTVDNKDILIPNSHFVGKELVNYNANPTRKLILLFDVSYDSDVDKVKDIIRKCIESNDNALLTPTPIVRLKALQDNSLQFQAVITCETSKYWDLYYELTDTVFNEFKRENISIPFNQLEVRLLNNESESPYRKDPLPKRTNDGKFIEKTNEDIIDKFSDKIKVQIDKKAKKQKNKEKQKD